MTATTNQEDTKVLFRGLCAYLKGEVVGYAIKNGMKSESRRNRTEEFEEGMAKAEIWKPSSWVTIRHIYYNWLRHGRPHTGSAHSDSDYLSQHSDEVRSFLRDIKACFGVEGLQLLGEELT